MDFSEAAKQPLILLVDDIELNCILTRAVLVRAGCAVDAVDSGAAALTAIETKTYDLILLDLEMPDLSGHEAAVLIQLREHGATRLAALSFRADDWARQRSREVGLHAHIARPLKPEELVRQVKAVLATSIADLADPWQRSIYKEFAARLGVERMQSFLIRMLEQFGVLLERLGADGPAEELHHLVHDVSSTSGMLGFVDASIACRKLMELRATPNECDAREALSEAVTLALKRLAQHLSTVPPLAA